MINCSKPLKIIISMLVSTRYLLWTVFFILQGRAIELAIKRHTIFAELAWTLAGYVFIKLLMMCAEIAQKYLIDTFKNTALEQYWAQHLPRTICRDNQQDKNNLQLAFFDYLPKIFDAEALIVSNRTTLFCIMLFAFLSFMYSGFFWEFAALLIIFLLNFLGRNLLINEINSSEKEIFQGKVSVLNWLEQYFAAFREISKNWTQLSRSSWHQSIYKEYYDARKKQIRFFTYRDLCTQALVELPFLINTTFVILGVYQHRLSLSQLFIWVGFSQFMINASNAYLDNRVAKKQLYLLNQKTKEIFCKFQRKATQVGNDKQIHKTAIKMRDGSLNRLSLEPGIHVIHGRNGAGKSTLMNWVLGYEREAPYFESTQLSPLKNEEIRVIEREAIIFSCFSTMAQQIIGPVSREIEFSKGILFARVYQLLGCELAKRWMFIFNTLELEYLLFEKPLSSGERVILSFMRFFASWHEGVRLVVVDECDAFLDQEKKTLFLQTMEILARRMAIYISCHDQVLRHHLEQVMVRNNKDLVV